MAKKSQKTEFESKSEKKPAKRVRKPKVEKPEAETKLTEQVAETTQVVEAPKPAEPAKPLSLKDKLLAGARAKPEDKVFDGSTLAQKLQEKSEISHEPELMAEFARLIESADQLGIGNLCLDRGGNVAREEWFNLSLTSLVDRLKDLARLDEEVAKLLRSLQDYLQNNFVSDTFWRVIQTIVRPFAKVNDRGELQKQLDLLVANNLAEKNPGHYDEEAVVISFGTIKVVYVPKRQRNPRTGKWDLLTLNLLAWQFVKQANKRVREGTSQRFKDLKAMEAKATLTAKEALEKRDGRFYVRSGTSRGLLFELAGGELRILEAIDSKVGNLPTRWLSWDDDNAWPMDARFAFKTWREKAQKSLSAGR